MFGWSRIPAASLLSLLLVGLVGVPALGAAGTDLWTDQFGTGESDLAKGVAVDAAGAAYVAGYTEGALTSSPSKGGYDAFLGKHSADGTRRWTRQFGTDLFDQALAVAVDGAGDLYVAGYTEGVFPKQSSRGPGDAFVRKYSPSGKHLWTRQFGTSAVDYAYGVAVDGSGNVYVAGSTLGRLPRQAPKGGTDAFVRKYSPSGKHIWTRQFGTETVDMAYAVAAAGSRVYVAGMTLGTLSGQSTAGNSDAFVRRYSAIGKRGWTRQFGTTGYDGAKGLSIDGSDNVYVAGYVTGTLPDQTPFGNLDAFARKYSGGGDDVWTSQFGTSGKESADSVAAYRSSKVYVAGWTWQALPGETWQGESDAYLRKYNGS